MGKFFFWYYFSHRVRLGLTETENEENPACLAAGCCRRGWLTGTCVAEDFAYDVVIRNGRLLDGLGNPWVRGSVAVKEGRIACIGRCDGTAAREIDAHDRYVSPGWIDLMDQSGEVLQHNGLAENKLLQGVTSAIAGEGGTPVPADADRRLFPRSADEGHFAQLRHLLQLRPGARRRDGRWRRRADAGAAGEDEGAGRDSDARRRDGHRDCADLSARQLSIHAGSGRAGESRCAIQRHLREPHAR